MHKTRVYALAVLVCLVAKSPAIADDHAQDSLAAHLDSVTAQVGVIQKRLAAHESDIANLKKIKISGYVQARYEYHDDAVSSPSLGTASTDSKNQGKLLNRFYVRRGRLKATYHANPNAQGVVYFDGSASGVSLKEAYVSLTEPHSKLMFTLGQFNWLFGYEISFSSSKREFPERARWSRTLFPGERDRGVKVQRAFPFDKQHNVTLQAGLYNGNGTEDKAFGANDPNKSKDFTARVTCKIGSLDAGISGYWGRQFNPSDSAIPVQMPSTTDKIRYGADAQYSYKLPNLGGGVIKAEAAVGKEPKSQSKAFTTADTTRDVFGYDVVWAQNLRDRFQFISRIDYYDPDRDTADDQFTAYGVGLIYFWDGNSKVKLVYEIPKTGAKARSGRVPDGSSTKDEKDNTVTLEWVYTF